MLTALRRWILLVSGRWRRWSRWSWWRGGSNSGRRLLRLILNFISNDTRGGGRLGHLYLNRHNRPPYIRQAFALYHRPAFVIRPAPQLATPDFAVQCRPRRQPQQPLRFGQRDEGHALRSISRARILARETVA